MAAGLGEGKEGVEEELAWTVVCRETAAGGTMDGEDEGWRREGGGGGGGEGKTEGQRRTTGAEGVEGCVGEQQEGVLMGGTAGVESDQRLLEGIGGRERD